MKQPVATYRLQFRNGFDFDKAIQVAPYLKALGVSHVYASPIFQARAGSTHGYDVTDHHRPDESLGGRQGFWRFSDELRALGLNLVLDIVPNHMAASPENPWWLDVLRHGSDSAYAGFFDIDWSQGRLLLPVLGKSVEEALDAGELALGYEARWPVFRYYDQAFPLDPQTWKLVFPEPLDEAMVPDLLARLSRDKALLTRVHDAQRYRLADWRQARDRLGYRRFFEISDLVGVRVEEDEVFDAVHSFIFELVEAGRVHGLRIDHVDGLADPAKYLADLRRKLPRPVPVWIEKILAADETLPDAWATVGATGYEFAADVNRLLTHGGGIGALDTAYRDYSGVTESYDALVAAAKVEIFTRNLEAELNALVRLANRTPGTEIEEDKLRAAIVALMAELPVYRTYFTSDEALAADLHILDAAAAGARRKGDAATVDRLVGLLKEGAPEAAAFRARFQQTSAALEAKAVEDTVFYRFNRLISANEVGAAPSQPTTSVAEFHRRMAGRAAHQPRALNGTATHDTKRGEDARMRIAAIAEAPADWAAAVRRFDEALGDLCDRCDANMRWLFYQSLLGAWEASAGPSLKERLSEFLLKAAREAKFRTSWVDPNGAYEDGLKQFVDGALSHDGFLAVFASAAVPLIRIGERKSLVQLALKLFAPGAPDIYQGTECADLSLVDPDNRRAVDFELRRRMLEDSAACVSDFDRRKMALLRFGLRARRQWPELFMANYHPVESGPRGIAFARRHAGLALYVAADLSGLATPSLPEPHGRMLDSFPEEEDIGVALSVRDEG